MANEENPTRNFPTPESFRMTVHNAGLLGGFIESKYSNNKEVPTKEAQKDAIAFTSSLIPVYYVDLFDDTTPEKIKNERFNDITYLQDVLREASKDDWKTMKRFLQQFAQGQFASDVDKDKIKDQIQDLLPEPPTNKQVEPTDENIGIALVNLANSLGVVDEAIE